MEENKKSLSSEELLDILVRSGAIPNPDSSREEKEIATTCEKVTGLLARHQAMEDHSVFDAMVIFSHLRKCESCRKKYQEKKEGISFP